MASVSIAARDSLRVSTVSLLNSQERSLAVRKLHFPPTRTRLTPRARVFLLQAEQRAHARRRPAAAAPPAISRRAARPTRTASPPASEALRLACCAAFSGSSSGITTFKLGIAAPSSTPCRPAAPPRRPDRPPHFQPVAACARRAAQTPPAGAPPSRPRAPVRAWRRSSTRIPSEQTTARPRTRSGIRRAAPSPDDWPISRSSASRASASDQTVRLARRTWASAVFCRCCA